MCIKVNHVCKQAFPTVYGNWHGSDLEKIDEKQYLNGNQPKETPVIIMQLGCNGWRVVTRQQFSNVFFLHEFSLLEELP